MVLVLGPSVPERRVPLFVGVSVLSLGGCLRGIFTPPKLTLTSPSSKLIAFSLDSLPDYYSSIESTHNCITDATIQLRLLRFNNLIRLALSYGGMSVLETIHLIHLTISHICMHRG
ncbi:hypothetical protein BDV38DRAFT_236279 [Aspergillus pseudotamarii]|uniref:Uncharacterized protein n=1 Tax=Aspergillus pseudotamarii TaxID=132259 RepID=A0A5N6T7P6_ASPPS|nr:uncharacterized protein BDV38DRAFT_236279 [Aspergillus pseudotamarii]KAE8142297.1 hypothetical protein BDV38DRAFT_236279 [Aspergillus pseudotamarii]